MGSAIYNTLTNAYLGPESDGTYNNALRRAAFDALAMQLLFYERLVCLADDLAVLPLLGEMVGVEYLVELLQRGELRLLRTRMVPSIYQGNFVWVTPRAVGKATFGRHDWPKVAWVKELPEAAAWIARRGFRHLDEPQISKLREAIIGATTEVDRGPIGPKVFGGLAEEVSRLNAWIVEAGHHKGDVVRLDEERVDEQRTEHRLAVLSQAVDRNRLERAVLNLVGLRHDAIVPSVAGLEDGLLGVKLHRTLSCDWGQTTPPVVPDGWGTGASLTHQDIAIFDEVVQTLEVPNVGDLLRCGAISPGSFVELRESRAAKALRRWYAENATKDPVGAAQEARELLASRARGSVKARAVDLLLAGAVGAIASGALMAGGVPPGSSIPAGAAVSVTQAWLGRGVAKLLCDRNHPLTIIERLRRDKD